MGIMDVRACKGCGKLFNYVGFGAAVCPDCKDAAEAKFQEVKEYIWNNKGANIPRVAEECDVSEQQIRDWIREERLEFAPGMGLTCESCGKNISSGRLCDACKKSVLDDLKSAYKTEAPQAPQKKDPDGGPKMRFLS